MVWLKFAMPELGGCNADNDDRDHHHEEDNCDVDDDDEGDYGDYGDDENSALHGPGAALRER